MSTNRILIIVAGVVILAAAAITGWMQWKKQPAPPAPQPVLEAPAPPPALPAQPAIVNPVPGAGATRAPLPGLAESDAPLRKGLVDVLGEPAIASWLVPDSIVRNVVATVDNLPRRKSPEKVRPLKTIPGAFAVDRQGASDQETITLAPGNYARYEPLLQLVRGADTAKLAAVYVRMYPLFQQQYEQLGYPGKYFNDRLVEVIDHLLATPDLKEPAALVQPNVLFEFAAPALEARSAGQKALLRMGPDNAAVMKAKLRELRAAITRMPPVAAPAGP